MCGVAGEWRSGGIEGDAERVLERMTGTLAHRGPDAGGTWIDRAAGIALGHRRLSILDLSATGEQPMRSPAGRWVVAYNGEIYNFAELRSELEQSGVRFLGSSDTEVLLAALDEWGLKEALERSAGMFAFAAWDRQTRTLHLARDRLGEKPLYYGWMGGSLLFGSELKSLCAHPRFSGEVDRGALALYLRHGYLPAPYSIYRHVRKLPPATILTVRGGCVEERRYWVARERAAAGIERPLAGSDCELTDALEVELRRTVRQEMVADVPLGAFLSGGIDSTVVVALMQRESSRPVRTFTIGFHERDFDEAGHARAVARYLGTEHTELYVTAEEARAVIPRLPALYDEPFADPSQIPTALVATLARQQVTVSLSGDGGDELFGGYSRYREGARLWGRLRWAPSFARAALGRALGPLPLGGRDAQRLAALLGAKSGVALYRQLISSATTPAALVRGAVEHPSALDEEAAVLPRGARLIDRLMVLDLITYLPDNIMVKVDRATMGVGLESRAPFLDHRIAELAWRLPRKAKLRDGQGKWILRQLLYRLVPRALVERPKMGFGLPIGAWVRGPLRGWARELIGEERLRRQGYLEPRAVMAVWREHEAGRHDRERLLWALLMFQAWLQATGLGA